MMMKLLKQSISLLCLILFFTACQPDKEDFNPELPDTPQVGNNGNNNNNGFIALPTTVASPSDNPQSAAKTALGRALFWDPILSGERDVACATCHHPARGYGDGLDLPIGVGGIGFSENRTLGYTGFVGRNSPTIINTAFNGINDNGAVNPENAPMFWDNRANSLEEQALLPLHSFSEMRGEAYPENETMQQVVSRLQNIPAYTNLFADAFGNNSINAENIGKALAAFQRTIIANNAPFDRFQRGDEGAMSPLQIAGMNTFQDVGCDDCHSGPMFSDYQLHVLGVRENNKLNIPDAGNGNFAFRTPTLRNLNFTGPYMHNGVFETLDEVLDFYDDNNNQSQNPNVNNNQLDNDLRQLDNLNNREIDEIIAFLGSLNDPNFDRTIPSSVPSGLTPGGAIQN